MQNNNPRNSTNQNNGNVRKKRRRRKQNLSLYYAAIFFLVAVVGIILSLTVFFNVKEVTVTGNSIYTNNDIILSSGIKTGDNLIRLSSSRAEKKIVSSLPYVDTATITKKFPDKVEIEVTPSKEFANIKLDIDSYKQLFRFLQKDETVIESLLNTQTKYYVDISYKKGKKTCLFFYYFFLLRFSSILLVCSHLFLQLR